MAFLQACRSVYFSGAPVQAQELHAWISRKWKQASSLKGVEILIQSAAANLHGLLASYRVLSPPMPYQFSVDGFSLSGRYVLLGDPRGRVWLPQLFWMLPEEAISEPSFADLCRWLHARSAGLCGRRSCGVLWHSVSDGAFVQFADLDLRKVRRHLELAAPGMKAAMKQGKLDCGPQEEEPGRPRAKQGDRMMVRDKKTGRPKIFLGGDNSIVDMESQEDEENQDTEEFDQ